jgi:hypothetical protein
MMSVFIPTNFCSMSGRMGPPIMIERTTLFPSFVTNSWSMTGPGLGGMGVDIPDTVRSRARYRARPDMVTVRYLGRCSNQSHR